MRDSTERKPDNGAPYTAVPVGYPLTWYVMDAARCTVGPGNASARVIRARCDEMNNAAMEGAANA